MIRRWEQGRALIDDMLSDGLLERVPANTELADEYLKQSRAHIEVAVLALEKDPVGSFQLSYDGARKALASLLVVQGLRPTSKGGHLAVYDAVMAQFGNGLEVTLRPFAAMRRLRNSSEYPSIEQPVANGDDAVRAQKDSLKMIEVAAELIDKLPVY